MAAGSTYTPIATTTVASATRGVTFSSIPSTYTDLVLVVSGTATSPSDCSLYFNGDSVASPTNYSWTRSLGTGSVASSARGTNTSGLVGTLYTTQGNIIISIMNYSNTTTYKTTFSRSNNANNVVVAWVNLWRNTAAINAMQFYGENDTISVGTTLTLYGIASA